MASLPQLIAAASQVLAAAGGHHGGRIYWIAGWGLALALLIIGGLWQWKRRQTKAHGKR